MVALLHKMLFCGCLVVTYTLKTRCRFKGGEKKTGSDSTLKCVGGMSFFQCPVMLLTPTKQWVQTITNNCIKRENSFIIHWEWWSWWTLPKLLGQSHSLRICLWGNTASSNMNPCSGSLTLSLSYSSVIMVLPAIKLLAHFYSVLGKRMSPCILVMQQPCTYNLW